jgi:hypothetical protein
MLDHILCLSADPLKYCCYPQHSPQQHDILDQQDQSGQSEGTSSMELGNHNPKPRPSSGADGFRFRHQTPQIQNKQRS